MNRTQTLDVGNLSFAYDSSRKVTGQAVPLNAESYTRVGMVANLDGTDDHLQFCISIAGTNVGNYILRLDNIELIPLKLPLIAD